MELSFNKCDEHHVIWGEGVLDKEMMPQTVKVDGNRYRLVQDVRGPLGQTAALLYPRLRLEDDLASIAKVAEEGVQNA